MNSFSCDNAKQIDLVDYLALLGHFPQKIRNQDYWFLSPFRKENNPSFKINRIRNIWFDFGEGKGGDIIDFGKRYFHCSVSELLQRLEQQSALHKPFFHPPNNYQKNAEQPPLRGAVAGERKAPEAGKILVVAVRPLSSLPLLHYLEKRAIPLAIAERFCKEVEFLLYHKKHTAIGFQNAAGGYELRSRDFKGSSSPKDMTFMGHGCSEVAVFEGFFNYLSFLTIQEQQSYSLTNFLVLNSLSFFEKAREKMEAHQHIHLFLDRDEAGLKSTQKALTWSDKYVDQSIKFKPYKDLNEYLMKYPLLRPKQSPHRGRHF